MTPLQLVSKVAKALDVSHQKLFEVVAQNLDLKTHWRVLYAEFQETGRINTRMYDYLMSVAPEEEQCQTSS